MDFASSALLLSAALRVRVSIGLAKSAWAGFRSRVAASCRDFMRAANKVGTRAQWLEIARAASVRANQRTVKEARAMFNLFGGPWWIVEFSSGKPQPGICLLACLLAAMSDAERAEVLR